MTTKHNDRLKSRVAGTARTATIERQQKLHSTFLTTFFLRLEKLLKETRVIALQDIFSFLCGSCGGRIVYFINYYFIIYYFNCYFIIYVIN